MKLFLIILCKTRWIASSCILYNLSLLEPSLLFFFLTGVLLPHNVVLVCAVEYLLYYIWLIHIYIIYISPSLSHLLLTAPTLPSRPSQGTGLSSLSCTVASLYPSPPLHVHMSSLYVCISILALWIRLSIALFYLCVFFYNIHVCIDIFVPINV